MTKIERDRGSRDLATHPVVLRDGTVLTEELATAWDREIEHRLKPGRPSIEPAMEAGAEGGPRSLQVSARVPRALLHAGAGAEAEGKPTSGIVR